MNVPDFPNENDSLALKERLNDTPLRLRERLKKMHPDYLSTRLNQRWSAIETIGHLIAFEVYFHGKLLAPILNKAQLKKPFAWKLKVDETNCCNYTPKHLIRIFTTLRHQTIYRLQKLNQDQLYKPVFHSIIKAPVRGIDLFFIVAAHDDKYVAEITEVDMILKAKIKNSRSYYLK